MWEHVGTYLEKSGRENRPKVVNFEIPCPGSGDPTTGYKKHQNGALAASSLTEMSINCRSISCMMMGVVTHTIVSN